VRTIVAFDRLAEESHLRAADRMLHELNDDDD
jgi:hypothetical protein